MERLINLETYSTPGVGVIAGRERGEFARAQERLDEVDRDAELTARVKIPDWVFSVNSSFALGLFSRSVKALGPEAFRRKYRFEGPNAVAVQEDCIRKAMLSTFALPMVRTA